jgi:hypothetical protein
MQRVPNAVVHEPGGFLAHADHAGYFVGTDAVAVVHHLPHGHKPFVDSERGILKYSSAFNGELTACVPRSALPAVVFFEELNAIAAASRASNAIRPSARHNPLTAIARIAKETNGFLKSGGLHS